MGTKLPKRPVKSEQLEQMMKTFAEHHGCEWQFCRKSETGFRICEILMGSAKSPMPTIFKQMNEDGGL